MIDLELMTTKTKRICSGEYKVIRKRPRNLDMTVRVTRVHYPNDGTYWIADPDWELNGNSDPLPSKKRAIEIARIMIKEAIDEDLRRYENLRG